MRAPLLVTTVLAAAILAACSATPDEDAASPSPRASTATTADATVGATSPGDTESPGQDQGEGGAAGGSEAFCGPMEAGAAAQRDLLDATDIKSAETGKEDDSGDVAVMNAAGEDMLAAIDRVVAQWSDAQAALDPSEDRGGDAGVTAAMADEAFGTYIDAAAVWVRPEAQIAAHSASTAEYDTATLALIGDATVTQAAVDGGEALGQILVYAQDRCGPLTAFE